MFRNLGYIEQSLAVLDERDRVFTNSYGLKLIPIPFNEPGAVRFRLSQRPGGVQVVERRLLSY